MKTLLIASLLLFTACSTFHSQHPFHLDSDRAPASIDSNLETVENLETCGAITHDQSGDALAELDASNPQGSVTPDAETYEQGD